MTGMRTRMMTLLAISLLVGAVAMSTALAEPLRLSPAPDGQTTDIRASEATSSQPGEAAQPIRLQIESRARPETFLFRQLQPQPYQRYEAKTRPLQKTLSQCLTYLDSMDSRSPSLQRISAFQAEASLDFAALNATLTPQEQAFQSYRLMHEAVASLETLSRYWRQTERLKRLSAFGTRRQIQEEQAILREHQTRIRRTLHTLNQLERVKQDLSAEMP